MVKICDFPCSTKSELLTEEARHVRELGLDNCLNYCIPGRTQKEWQQDNAEIISEQKKIYYIRDKERIKKVHDLYYKNNKEKVSKYHEKYREENRERRREKMTCVCGAVIQRVEKARHERTQRHQNFIKNPVTVLSKITCICGSVFRKSSKSRHEKSQKHIKILEQNVKENPDSE